MQEPINSQSMLKVGTILRGIYRIDSYLSSGGFGNTYVATNIEFDERVAIKEFFMKGVTQRDGNQTTVSVSNVENQDSFLEQREKFKKEARRLRQLNNPHIVKVHDLFEENGTAYYAMDYVDGENLSDRLKRTSKPMTEAEVNEILPQILDALKSVHDTGIWHLDLKPANIMVDKNGQVKLIDFGASKQLNAQKGGATTSTAISYTNGYAPREQMEQNYDKFGPWTDLYALGATLYSLLTNKRPPLPSDIDDDVSEDKHLALPMPANMSDAMKQLVLWLIQTNRLQRPKSINELTNKLPLIWYEQPNSESKAQYSDEDTITGSTSERTITEISPKSQIETLREKRSFHKNTKWLWVIVIVMVVALLARLANFVYSNYAYSKVVAQYRTGKCYYKGEGVSQNYNEAAKWYRKAAEQGFDSAQCALGNCYILGKGVSQDTIEAAKWFHKAAEQGNASGQYNLGVCYYYGYGVNQDYTEAVKWFHKAAEQGNASGQYNLGICYYYGHGINQDYTEAVKWFRKAVKQGNTDSQYQLGICYATGVGVNQDYNEAVKYPSSG